MRGWKAKLRPGSFRGIQFFIDTSQYGGGRRGATHEFPGRDDGYREDLGRKVRTYKVDCYLLGSDYTTQRNALISALEATGSGELVHPYYGRVVVCVEGDFNVQESTKEGGFAKFSIPFVEAGSPAFPSSGADTAGNLLSAAGALDTANQSFLSKALNVASQPQFVLDSVSSKVDSFADAISSNTDRVSGTAQGIANLAFSIQGLKDNVIKLLNTPATLAEQMQSALNFMSAALNPSDVLGAAHSLFSFGSSDIPFAPSTSTRATQAAALSGLNTFVQVAAVSAAAKVIAVNSYDSYNDALNTRDQVNGQIDILLESVADDNLYNSLQLVQTSITKAVPQPGQDLPSLDSITLQQETNSLSLCYDLYGSVDLESDVIARNKISNPGFLPGGVALEVIDANAG